MGASVVSETAGALDEAKHLPEKEEIEPEEFPFDRVRLWWPGRKDGEEDEVTDEAVEALERELRESAERDGLRMVYRTEEEIEAGIWPGHAGKGGSLRKKPRKKVKSSDDLTKEDRPCQIRSL